jgi:ribosomal protein L29
MKGKGDLIKDLQSKSVKDLVEMRNELRKEKYDLGVKNTMRALTKTHEIRLITKNIARVETFLASKLKENHGSNMK